MRGPRECVTLEGRQQEGLRACERGRVPGRGHSPCKGPEVGSKPSKEALGPKDRRKNQGGISWVASGPKGEEVRVGSEQRGIWLCQEKVGKYRSGDPLQPLAYGERVTALSG